MLLDKINSFDARENQLTLFRSQIPSPYVILIDYFFSSLLDKERPMVNLGAYTGRDLDWFLPICKRNKKTIECVESFAAIKDDNKKAQLIDEIENKYSSPLLTWTWDDASLSQSLRSADYVFFSTDHRFPIEEHILSTNHPCIWSFTSSNWLWPRIGNALHNKQLHLLVECGMVFFTNSEEHVERFRDSVPQLSEHMKKWNYYFEWGGELWRLRNSTLKDGMTQQWNFINSL